MPAPYLVDCPTCGNPTASTAPACPKCGCPHPARVAQQAAKKPARWGMRLLVGFVALLALSLLTLPDSTESIAARASADSLAAAEAVAAEALAATLPPPMPDNSFAIERAAEDAIARVARDPESVEVLGCTAPASAAGLGGTYPDGTSRPGWTVSCEYTARNGFGGTNRETLSLAVMQSRGAVVAVPYAP